MPSRLASHVGGPLLSRPSCAGGEADCASAGGSTVTNKPTVRHTMRMGLSRDKVPFLLNRSTGVADHLPGRT